MKRPQFWYVPPCCRRFRAPAPSPPACASRPPSPPRPLWRSAPSGELGGGKGGSLRRPSLRSGRRHIAASARAASFVCSPLPGCRCSPLGGCALRRAGWPGSGALRRAGNHPTIHRREPSGFRAAGRRRARRGLARCGALRRLRRLCRPLPSAPCALLRLFAFVPRAREIQPLCARALVCLGWRWGASPLVPAPRSRRGRFAAAASSAVPREISFASWCRGAAAQAPRRRWCALGRCGLRGGYGATGATSSALPILGHFCGLRWGGLRGCAAELRPAVRPLVGRTGDQRLRRAAKKHLSAATQN